MDALETYRAQKKRMNEQLKEFGRDLFMPFFTKLFLDYPEAQRVRWVQYTPYFNDGEPCVFCVHEPSVTRHVALENDDDGEDERWIEAWNAKTEPVLAVCAQEIGKFFNGIEDCLETAFGDGVEVYIDRSGSVTVNDYSHD